MPRARQERDACVPGDSKWRSILATGGTMLAPLLGRSASRQSVRQSSASMLKVCAPPAASVTSALLGKSARWQSLLLVMPTPPRTDCTRLGTHVANRQAPETCTMCVSARCSATRCQTNQTRLLISASKHRRAPVQVERSRRSFLGSFTSKWNPTPSQLGGGNIGSPLSSGVAAAGQYECSDRSGRGTMGHA